MVKSRNIMIALGSILGIQEVMAETQSSAQISEAVAEASKEAVQQAEAYLKDVEQDKSTSTAEEKEVAAAVSQTIKDVNAEMKSGVPTDIEQQAILATNAEFLALAAAQKEPEANKIAEKLDAIEDKVLDQADQRSE